MEVISKKYFSGDHPINAAYATATIEFSDVVADGQIVTIGNEVYEFDTDSSITEGNIAVDVSGGVTATAAAAALLAAISGNENSVFSAEAVEGKDAVKVTYSIAGETGNSIAISTDCTNGSWGENITTLLRGAKGTFAGEAGLVWVYNDTLYFSIAPNDEERGRNWRSVSLTVI